MIKYEEYKKAKTSQFSPCNDREEYPVKASQALNIARRTVADKATRAEWDKLDGWDDDQEQLSDIFLSDEPYTNGSGYGPLRIITKSDDCHSIDDLLGDTYKPFVNTDIKPSILEAEKDAYIEKINNDGVWGYIAQYWNGESWDDADSIWGFVGDEFKASVYREDLMNSAMTALKTVKTYPCCGRPTEEGTEQC